MKEKKQNKKERRGKINDPTLSFGRKGNPSGVRRRRAPEGDTCFRGKWYLG